MAYARRFYLFFFLRLVFPPLNQNVCNPIYSHRFIVYTEAAERKL